MRFIKVIERSWLALVQRQLQTITDKYRYINTRALSKAFFFKIPTDLALKDKFEYKDENDLTVTL